MTCVLILYSEMRIHKAKLGQIQKKGATEGSQGLPVAKKNDAKAVVKELKRINQVKMANKAFNKNEKNIGISRENQILLSKLVEISSGKKSSIPKLPSIKQARAKNVSSAAQTSTMSNVGPTSLNLAVRQRETLRVEAENHAFARRLFESRPMIRKAEFDAEYFIQKRYKKNLLKVPKNKTLTNRSASVATIRGMREMPSEIKQQLPPLDENQSQDKPHTVNAGEQSLSGDMNDPTRQSMDGQYKTVDNSATKAYDDE